MAHQESLENLLGERRDELSGVVSLEKRVKRSAPPFFIWHTADDTSVPVENSLLLEKALRAKGIDAELHIFPHGAHGQSLADHTVFTASQAWPAVTPGSRAGSGNGRSLRSSAPQRRGKNRQQKREDTASSRFLWKETGVIPHRPPGTRSHFRPRSR